MRHAVADSMPAVLPVDVLGEGDVCPRGTLAAVEAGGKGADVESAIADGRAVELESP